MTASPRAQAEVGLAIALQGGVNLGTQTISPTPYTLGTGAGVSTGLQVGYAFLPWLGAETGVWFAERVDAFQQTVSAIRNSGTSAFPNLIFPLDLRFKLFLEGLHARTGVYLGAGVGSVSTTTWSQTTPGTTTVTDFATAQKSAFDFGLVEGISYRYPIVGPLGVIGDFRYLYGLLNIDTSGAGFEAYRDIQIHVGLDLQF